MKEKINEQFVVNKVIDFMINKENGNWHEEKVEKSDLHKHGVDIKLVGGKEIANIFILNVKVNLMQNLLNQLIEKGGLMH